jgi:nucleotide-binding universal stress UspA family protein
MKILLAVDGSPYTRRMLATLAAHDEWFGPGHQYTVLHAVPEVPKGAAAKVEREVLKAYYADAADKVFKPIRSFLGRQGIEARYLHKIGRAAPAIAAEATRGGHQIVILGSHGHGALVNLVMGSVATQVLAQCKVPVLIVR